MHSLSLNADFAATEKLLLTAGASYSDARAEWKDMSVAYNAPITDAVLTNLYDPTLMSAMTAYSDLHFQQTDATVGATYRFTPALYTTASAAWQWFQEKEQYVYGDQDGKAWRASLGVGYKF